MKFPQSATLFISFVVAISAVLVVAASRAVSSDQYPEMLLFIILIVVAAFLHAQDPAGGVVSSTGTLFYAGIYVFHPIAAFLVVAIGYAIGNALPRAWVTWRACFNGAQMGLSALLGSLVFRGLGGDAASDNLTSQLIPIIMGPLTHQIANNFFIGFLISRMRGTSLLRTWVSFVEEFLGSNLLSIPTAILIAVLYTRIHHAFVLIFLLLLPFQRWTMRLFLEERSTFTRIIESLVRASELSHPRTKGHARRVADISVAIGRHLGLVEREIDSLEYAALLHDIGMIGLDEEVIVRSDSAKRWELIEEHARIGSEISSELPRRELPEMIRNHHQPFERSLVPRAPWTKGASMPARIIALAEEVDSRLHGLFPYPEPEALSAVLDLIVGGRGSRFDPTVVEAFIAVFPGESVISKELAGEQRIAREGATE